jgi:anti-anti-sigma factor
MHYTILAAENGLTASLNGRFTFADHQAFRALVAAIERAAGSQVALDLASLDFIDSAALGMLLVANDACRKGGQTMIVRHPKGQVRRTLEISAMHAVFQIQD